MQCEPFLRGLMWNAHQEYVQVQGNVVVSAPRPLVMGSVSIQWCIETVEKKERAMVAVSCIAV